MFIRTGKKIDRLSIKPRRQRFLRLEPLEDRRMLVYTSIATATTAVMTGDLASDADPEADVLSVDWELASQAIP